MDYLLKTEIIPVCLRIMETGSELSKTVATFIVQKILMDDQGLSYICATPHRFFAVNTVLDKMVEQQVAKTSSRLLKHVVRCYHRLANNDRAKDALRDCLPSQLLDDTFQAALKDDRDALKWLNELGVMLGGDSAVATGGGGGIGSAGVVGSHGMSMAGGTAVSGGMQIASSAPLGMSMHGGAGAGALHGGAGMFGGGAVGPTGGGGGIEHPGFMGQGRGGVSMGPGVGMGMQGPGVGLRLPGGVGVSSGMGMGSGGMIGVGGVRGGMGGPSPYPGTGSGGGGFGGR